MSSPAPTSSVTANATSSPPPPPTTNGTTQAPAASLPPPGPPVPSGGAPTPTFALIVGIVIGALVVLLGMGILIFFCRRKKKRREQYALTTVYGSNGKIFLFQSLQAFQWFSCLLRPESIWHRLWEEKKRGKSVSQFRSLCFTILMAIKAPFRVYFDWPSVKSTYLVFSDWNWVRKFKFVSW